jgi:hypothetical protein
MSQAEKGAVDSLIQWANVPIRRNKPLVLDLLSEWIDQSSLPESDKREALSQIFANSGSYSSDWLMYKESDAISKVLIKHGVLIPDLGEHKDNPTAKKVFYKNASSSINGYIESALALYRSDPRAAQEKVRNLVLNIWGKQKKMILNTPESAQMKGRFIHLLSQVGLRPSEQIELLSLMTSDGPDKAIDQRLIEIAKTTQDPAILEQFFKNKNSGFQSPKSLNEYMERWMDLKLVGKKELTVEEMKTIKKQLIEVLQDASSVRDDLLEKLAWATPDATRDDLFDLEKAKLSRRLFEGSHEVEARVASSIGTYVQNLPKTEITDLIRHIQMNPGEPLPEKTKSRLVTDIMNDPGALIEIRDFLGTSNGRYVAGWAAFKGKNISNQDLAELAVDWTDRLLVDLRGDDRVPLLDFLLHSGREPIASQPYHEAQIMKEFLPYKDGSDDEKVLRAFLDSVPDHEKTVTLSYIMAQQSETGETSLAPLFDAFGTPGKKAAQAVSIWKLLGDRSNELDSFKSSARPMSKFRFRSIMESELPPEQWKTLRIKRLMNAASIKTVAEVQDPSGTWVMGVLDPNALAQSQSQFSFGKKFVANLEKEGLKSEHNLVTALLGSMEEQIKRETDARIEGRNLVLMRKAGQEISTKYSDSMHGWTFDVPKLHPGIHPTQSVLLMSKAEGVEYGSLPKDVKAEAGEENVRGLLRIFMEKGYWDADRHAGNELYEIGPNQKIIHLIDLAQTEFFRKRMSFLPDERTDVLEFLYALAKRDPVYLARKANVMSTAKALNNDGVLNLSEKLKTLFERNLSPQEQLVEVFKSLSENGVTLKSKYSVGVLKGLVTVHGENYVPPEQLTKIFEEVGGEYMKGKKGWTAISAYQNLKLKNPEMSTRECLVQLLRMSVQSSQ